MGITQEKGDLGLVCVIADITKQGFAVSLPVSESRKYDLIVEKDNICKTVQVKYAKIYRGSIVISLRSVWTNGSGYQTRKKKKSDFDIIAVYCPNTDQAYYLRGSEMSSGNAVNLRVNDPGKFHKNCRMAKDFTKLSF